jgi:PAS domain S-box-containing protein
MRYFNPEAVKLLLSSFSEMNGVPSQVLSKPGDFVAPTDARNAQKGLSTAEPPIADILQVHHALEYDEIIPVYQPFFELRTGRLVGFEVLARLAHSQLGLVLPEGFISLAEDNGLMGQLMGQMLRKIFRAARDVPAPLVLAVNVSPIQLRHLGLASQIRDAAKMAGFPLERLIVEITESAFLNNVERAQTITSELKAMGCMLALDDFGTGYSSLGHLQALPFDHLKIDGSFVKSMTNTRGSRKIVGAIIGLGRSLGLTIVAEGVETAEQADVLLYLGCDLVQGWLYGRPVPAEAIPSTIAAALRRVSAGGPVPVRGMTVSSLEALPAERLAQLQAIYDGAPLGLCFLDRTFRYVSLNKKLAQMNGASVSSHLGRTVKEMFPERFPRCEPYLLSALQGHAIASVEIAHSQSEAGQPDRTILVSYQPAWDEADEVIGISVSVLDVTEQKRSGVPLLDSEDRERLMVQFHNRIEW